MRISDWSSDVCSSDLVVKLGDSAFPVSAGSGGQWGANSSTAGVYAACAKLREAVAAKLGLNAADAEFVDGEIRSGDRRVSLGDAAGDAGLVAEGRRSEARRGGKECVSTCRSRWVADN